MTSLIESSSIKGIYIHIPYCLQRCHYCDFATFKVGEIPPTEEYFSLLHQELASLEKFFAKGPLESIYFGGGTPSLAKPEQISSLLSAIKSYGFSVGATTEVTIEINPATISHTKMKDYLRSGVNRFSVGAQTFNNLKLKVLGREHDVEATRDTLQLLKDYNVNYSFDLLYALPHQSLDELEFDLAEIEKWSPPHISPYCLTLPDNHFLQKNRPTEEHQIKMFELLNSRLNLSGYERYEISNFSKQGFSSRHNQLYWNQSGVLGLGLSSYSYLSTLKTHNYGFRFWNPKTYKSYELKVQSLSKGDLLDLQDFYKDSFEFLTENEALTEYCYTALRQKKGIFSDLFLQKFHPALWEKVKAILLRHVESGYIINQENKNFYLSEQGVMISNMIFSDLTFLEEDL